LHTGRSHPHSKKHANFKTHNLPQFVPDFNQQASINVTHSKCMHHALLFAMKADFDSTSSNIAPAHRFGQWMLYCNHAQSQ
jgi:hypothetical protein